MWFEPAGRRFQMKKTRSRLTAAALIVVGALVLHLAQARQAGSKRTDLQRHDLSAPGREVSKCASTFDPGYVAPMHTHPGEEIIYVIEGTLECEIGGKVTRVKAGDVLFVPAGTPHSAKKHRHHPCGRACYLCRRERQTAHHAREVRQTLRTHVRALQSKHTIPGVRQWQRWHMTSRSLHFL